MVAPAIGNWAKDFADTLATLDKRVTVFDTLKARMDGFAKGLGFEGVSSAWQGWESIRDGLFGRADQLVKDTEKMGRAFEQFRRMGEDFRAAVESFKGADSFGGKVEALRTGIGSLSGALLGASMLTMLGTAFAFRKLAKAVAAVALSGPFRVVALA